MLTIHEKLADVDELKTKSIDILKQHIGLIMDDIKQTMRELDVTSKQIIEIVNVDGTISYVPVSKSVEDAMLSVAKTQKEIRSIHVYKLCADATSWHKKLACIVRQIEKINAIVCSV
jgi:hypothetical protein